MIDLAALSFASPAVLAAFAALPVLFLLLKLTPPSPRQVAFPAVRILFEMKARTSVAVRSPWWLLLLRLLIAAGLILAAAGPRLNAVTPLAGSGPLVILIDNDWSVAGRWTARVDHAMDLVERAEKAERRLVVVPLAEDPDPAFWQALSPAQARERLLAIVPRPWPDQRADHLAGQAELLEAADVFWLSSGMTNVPDDPIFNLVQNLPGFVYVSEESSALPVLLSPDRAMSGLLQARLQRFDTSGALGVNLLAMDENGALLHRQSQVLQSGDDSAMMTLDLPAELANRITRLHLEGRETAASIALLDNRWRQRIAGFVADETQVEDQPLLDPLHYPAQALQPYAQLRRGGVETLMSRPLSLIVWADQVALSVEDRARLATWVDEGGVLVRFAGSRLSEQEDPDLVPVRLRRGERVFGGAMTWQDRLTLESFAERGPFAGLAVPTDLKVDRQILMEPTLDSESLIWAQLSDGTPLVTGARRGNGWQVLFHVTATPEWSNVPLSGVFENMMERLLDLGSGVVQDTANALLPPWRVMTANGLLEAPVTDIDALNPTAQWMASSRQPPGLYGEQNALRAFNLAQGLTPQVLTPGSSAPFEVARYEQQDERPLAPFVLLAVAVLFIVDWIVSLRLRGWLRGATAALALVMVSQTSMAQSPPENALWASIETRLAYMVTGDAEVDRISRLGLEGLRFVLFRRTAAELGEPMAFDPETGDPSFFPLIYWPITGNQQSLSSGAIERLNFYLNHGGMLLIDTRGEPAARDLQRLTRDLDLPALRQVPSDHVLTRSFYLMRRFPGRFDYDDVWLEKNSDSRRDSVSNVLIGSNSWAEAWARDETRRPLFQVVPGGELQREQAYRFGVNVVMYVLTGNYKADQVHVPAILQRIRP